MKVILQLIGMQWKEARRSPLWNKNLIINIVLAVSFLYLIGMFVLLGVFLDDILIKISVEGIDYRTYKESFVLRRLNQYLLYYFFMDLILRCFIQKLPALSVQPLLHLPISKSKLVHFMLGKSIWSPINWAHGLIFVPFILELFENLPFDESLFWSIGLVSVVYLNNFLLIYIKRTSEVDFRVYLGMLALLVGIVSADWFDLIDFQQISAGVFNAFFLNPISLLAPIGIAAIFYALNFRFLKSNLYMDRLSTSKQSEISYVGAGFLSRFGVVGRLTELEFKFIWRNKRTRSVLLITIMFLGYGLLVFPTDEYAGNHLMYVLFSVIITGMFILNYGQYLLGWEGSHFDHILTRKVDFSDYYKSKFLLFAIVSGSAMLLSIPYAYFGWEILLVVFSVFLFNIGVGSHCVMFFGSLNPKKIDLSKGTVLNWQGVGAAQFMLVIPVLGLPLCLFGIGVIFDSIYLGIGLIAAFGVIGLIGTNIWIGWLAKWLTSQRYKISRDFRNQ
ncbi:MAG TPA: hypothetical protein DCX14_12505 [Flavobacteriales bacterium]|nr:hypothetical protein [Flavobacteriales bacterium]